MIKKDAILVHSIGCGCDTFYRVIRATPKTLWVRELKSHVTWRDVKRQTTKIIPGTFVVRGSPTIRLRVHPDGRIGPEKRLMWWKVFNGEPEEQFSP